MNFIFIITISHYNYIILSYKIYKYFYGNYCIIVKTILFLLYLKKYLLIIQSVHLNIYLQNIYVQIVKATLYKSIKNLFLK